MKNLDKTPTHEAMVFDIKLPENFMNKIESDKKI